MARVALHWWHFPPYTRSAPGTPWAMSGVLPVIVERALTACQLSEVTASQVANPRAYETLGQLLADPAPTDPAPTDLTMFLPFTTDTDGVSYLALPSHADFVPLVSSPGSVLYFKNEAEPAGSDLLTVILQGWPMLVLILLGAAYSGIIIWLLDRLWNPSNFPKPFIRGFWEGFWWAFVTMTTVGYGDTTPRSFQARIYGLVWIVVGITILSVFTATVTTVLTQESMGTHHVIFGNKIGLVNGTEDYRLVVNSGGQPIAQETLEDVFEDVRQKNSDSALYDQFAFAAEQSNMANDFLVERIVGNPVLHGVLLAGGDVSVRECVARELRARKGEAFHELMKNITPFTPETLTSADTTQDLFQPQTITYMWYGLAVWLTFFIGFILWEFIYWRPKHKRRQAMKKQLNLERGIESPGTDDDQTSCFPKRPSAMTRSQRASLRRLASEPKNQTAAAQRTELAKTPASPADGLSRTPSTNNQKKQLIEVGDLESLVRRQKVELVALDEELAGYTSQWETRLRDLKRQHREERRKLLRLMDHDDSIWNETQQQRRRSPRSLAVPTVSQTKVTNYGKNVLGTEQTAGDIVRTTGDNPLASGEALPFDEQGFVLPFDDDSIVSSI